MTIRPSDLPDFSDPPVVETVLSVQFDRLSSLRTAHFGLYWNEIRGRFPVTEERVELSSVMERPPGQPPVGIGIQFEALQSPPVPRFWFANESGTELIQLQRDRYIKNWRKTGEGAMYPRYERVKDGFERDFSAFQDFVTRHRLGKIRVNQCEVTYVNHIVAGQGWNSHSDIGKVFNTWRQPETVYPGPAEELMFQAGFPMRDKNGAFVGRLHATVQSVMRLADGVPMFRLDLTARGLIGDDTTFFDLGREWIVRSFKELTTPAMHTIWGLRS